MPQVLTYLALPVGVPCLETFKSCGDIQPGDPERKQLVATLFNLACQMMRLRSLWFEIVLLYCSG